MSLDGIRILVVEDDPALGELYRRYLEREGARVDIATGGSAAAERIREERLDLLILDLELEDQERGEDLLRRLEEEGREIPAVVITGHDEIHHAIEVMPYRVASYHLKSPEILERLPEIAEAALQWNRKRAGERREPEARARGVFEGAATGMMLLAPEEVRIIEINPSAAALFGMEPKQLIGSPLLDRIATHEEELFTRKLEQASAGGSVTGKVDAVRSDDSQFPFGYRMNAIRVMERPMVLLMGRDLTQTAHSETRYRQLFETSIEPMVIIDSASGETRDCNPAFERLVGWTREDLLGLQASELRIDTERDPFLALLGSSRPGEFSDYESSMVRRDGQVIEVLIRGGVFLLGGQTSFVEFVRDLTAERRAEERYKEIFLRSEPIFIIDARSLSIVDANPACAEMLEAPLGQFTGRGLEELVGLEEEDLERVLDRARHEPVRLEMSSPGGEVIPVSVLLSDFSIGQRDQCMVRVRDLRQDLRAQQLEQGLAHAQKMQSLGQMASGIAHDFNNTLMAALPWADLLRRKFPEDETIQKAASHVRNAVHRAREVTRQLLDFAQPRPPEIRRVDLAHLVRQQLKIIRPAFPPAIEIETELDSGDLFIDADPAQVGQALLNLALNARDALAQGGVIRIAVRGASPEEQQRWSVASPGWVSLSVTDNGSGMSRETLRRVFDPFFTTKDVGKGAGLGLAVVHRIIEQHRGGILIDSTLGTGTTVSLLFPAAGWAQQAESDAESAALPVGQRLRGKRILVIDDEPEVVEGIAMLLEMEGARVAVSHRGAEALKLIDGGLLPDLIILDLGLPEMTGEEIHRQIRERLEDVPILIATGYGDQERIAPLTADPFTSFRQKPFELDEVIRQLSRAGWGESPRR